MKLVEWWGDASRGALWMRAQRSGMPRRELLALLSWGGIAAVAAACRSSERAPEPPAPSEPRPATADPPRAALVKPTPERDFILHGEKNAEMRFEAMADQGHTTPNARFFVRNHAPTPRIDAKTWKLSVRGSGIERPLELTYDELMKLPSATFTRYIDCAGNGRSFYEALLGKKADGDPWRLGAFGVATWTGVPLSELLRRAGVKKSAVDVMPIGLDGARVERPMPIAKAMEDDTLLAHHMNGEPLPPDHGFPARVIVPGWVGIANIKWVGEIVVSETPIFVEKNTKEYVLIGPDWAPKPPAEGPILYEQVLKSAVALPWPATLRRGPQKIAGYAWSPAGKIAKVDVSLDGGKSFLPAALVGPNIERAAVRWELAFEATEGEITMMPRATDEASNAQPGLEQQKWNRRGYIFGAMVPHPAKVVA